MPPDTDPSQPSIGRWAYDDDDDDDGGGDDDDDDDDDADNAPTDEREGDCEDFDFDTDTDAAAVAAVVDDMMVLHGVALSRIPDEPIDELLVPGYMRPGTTTLSSGDLARAGSRTFTSPSI